MNLEGAVIPARFYQKIRWTRIQNYKQVTHTFMTTIIRHPDVAHKFQKKTTTSRQTRGKIVR